MRSYSYGVSFTVLRIRNEIRAVVVVFNILHTLYDNKNKFWDQL